MSNVHDQIQSSGPDSQDKNPNMDGDEPAVVDQRLYDGYPKLARLMGSYPAMAIFRRFGDLNMLNLLRLQAELQDLEHKLQEIRDEDDFANSKDPIRTAYVTDFKLMRDLKDDGDSLQYDMLVSIGEKLQEYNAAMAEVSRLTTLAGPSYRELDFLRKWLNRPAMGNSFLRDSESTVWDKSNERDLITLAPRRLQRDMFTALLDGAVLDLYHRVWGNREKTSESADIGPDFREYKDEKIMAVSNSVGAIFSSLLPTVAILVLYFVRRTLMRIGLIIVFTAIFSLSLSVFTEARQVEIFSATAAFAAVEVVFIGTTGTNSTG